jgi:hypothetical protein
MYVHLFADYQCPIPDKYTVGLGGNTTLPEKECVSTLTSLYITVTVRCKYGMSV